MGTVSDGKIVKTGVLLAGIAGVVLVVLRVLQLFVGVVQSIEKFRNKLRGKA